MRRLYMQIAGGVILAVIVGWTAVGLFIPRMRSMMEQGLADQLLGSGLRAVGARLDATSPDQWDAQLAQVRREITIPLAIVRNEDLPDGPPVSRLQPTIVHPGGADLASIYIPMANRTHVIVAGPLEQPPVAPLVAVAIVFVFVLTVTASAFVGVPLVRRLRKVSSALADLGGGNWATRLDANAEGALSELAESVNEMAAQLHEQFQERESLLQAVSHEIGTPLSRIRFRLEQLEQEASTPEQRKRLEALAGDLDDLDQLSSELVGWMDTDASQQARRDFDVCPVLESLIELECQPAGRTLHASLTSPTRPLVIRADQRQFQRAMENLLRNAVRYASSAIVIDVAEAGRAVCIEVRDDGPGVPADQRTRVLEPFVRGDGQPSTAHRGLGLGLAIVRRIVAAHDGIVTIGEAPEGGAAVRTTWPRA
ncbi:MAG: ATP-binding protein [Vicinamibacterales bacterium]